MKRFLEAALNRFSLRGTYNHQQTTLVHCWTYTPLHCATSLVLRPSIHTYAPSIVMYYEYNNTNHVSETDLAGHSLL